jgi:hypothetical protein
MDFLKNLVLATAVIVSFGALFGALTLKSEQAPAAQTVRR